MNTEMELEFSFEEYTDFVLSKIRDPHFTKEEHKEKELAIHFFIGMLSEHSEIVEASSNMTHKELSLLFDENISSDKRLNPRVLNWIEEIGDVLFYVNGFCNIYNISFAEVVDKSCDPTWIKEELLLEDYDVILSDLSDIFKKDIFYGKEYSKDDMKELLCCILNSYIHFVGDRNLSPSSKERILMKHKIIQYAVILNYRKLNRRYKNGFTTEEAINRNVSEEYKSMKDDNIG